MEDNSQQNPTDPEEETPAQRLRRILAASQRKGQSLPQEPAERRPLEEPARESTAQPASLPANDAVPSERTEAAKRTISGDTQRILIPEEPEAQPSAWDEFLDNASDFLKDAVDRAANWIGSIQLPRLGSGGRGRRKPPRSSGTGKSGCLVRGLVILAFGFVIVTILGLSFILIQYFTIAAGLPSVEDLRQYASQFETTRIYDRNGSLIYEILDPNAGRRTYTTLDDVSPFLIAATIATEDKDFYTNPGFDPLGIVRAFWQNYTSGEVVSGASTITQQLARTLLLSPEERNQITTQRKAREIVLAAEITRRYSKDEILELYLNEIYYGNLAYGIEAAAETYFSTTAGQLNLAEASFLAGLPQAPAVYDVYTNRDAAELRQSDVLGLMVQLSSERNCIRVNQSNVPICVTLNEAVAAAQEIDNTVFEYHNINMPYPHWVNYIRTQLEAQYDPQTIYRSGFRVYTTLDPTLQDYAQTSLTEQVEALAANNATDGALVAIQPSSGQILAMVGSADFFSEAISGQVNMAVAPRQPGSSIKPLTYTAAFEKGWTPATLIWDVPSEFPPSGDPDDTRDPYKPVNYDGKYHGPVLARTALANSYNIPAVKTLNFVGIYDDPATAEKEGFIAFAERMGITTLTRDDYGLSLTLGGGDVSLLELTGAYAVFANQGQRMAPYSIERIEDHSGNIVYQHEAPAAEQTISRDHAYLISSILSDNQARTPAFGSNSVLKLPFSAAVKTGTTNDFRDNWTLGYTPDIAIGVWIGNADYTPMTNISGVTGAAPLWANVMQWAVDYYWGGSPSEFVQPDTVQRQTICAASGASPSSNCPSETKELFADGQPPLDKKDDLWKDVEVDTWTNLKASSACSEYVEEKKTVNVSDPWAIKWLTGNDAGKAWAKDMDFSSPLVFTPQEECSGDSPRPAIIFVGLDEDSDISTPYVDIYAVVNATKNFKEFKLQYGVGNNPTKWKTLMSSTEQYDQPKHLISWDVYEADATRITMRIYMESTKGTFAEKRIHLNLLVPTLTPTMTVIPTLTPVPPTAEPIIATETPVLVPTNTPFGDSGGDEATPAP
jgi:penicillin-binding protein 1C